MAEPSGTDKALLAELLQDMVLESVDVGEILAELVALVSEALSTGDTEVSCSISLLRPRKKATVASSSQRAKLLDEMQYAYDHGPCLTAARDNVEVRVDDVDHDPRFRTYLDAVRANGIKSMLAVPIPLDGNAQAALNLYATRLGALDFDVADRAGRLAREASRS